MPKIVISTKDGEVVDIIDTEEWNLEKPMAKADLLDQIMDAVRLAQTWELAQE